MVKNLLLTFFLLVSQSQISFSQEKLTRNCAAEIVHQQKMENNPHYRESYRQVQNKTSQYLNRNNKNISNSGIRNIPIYVHVLYNESNPEENISTAQIESQISVINEDFRATNNDISQVPEEFSGVVSDYEIQFELINITRNSSTRAEWGTNDDMKKSAQGGIDPITPETHLNIWVCEIGGGILGYAQFPGGPSSTDGVVVGPEFFGDRDQDDGSFYLQSPFDKGRTLTHEIGHYLNLRHIWGDGDCSADDFVEDTPVAGASNNGCPTYPSKSCTENTSYTSDMFMNYMDYVNDECMFMFSEGQKTRTLSIFELGGARENLGTLLDGCDLPAPSNLQPSNITNNSFDLTWDEVPEASEYEIYYGNSSVFSSSNSVTIDGLNSGVQLDVKVRALCAEDGNGLFSNILEVTTTGCPEGPAILTIVADNYGEDIRWTLNLDGTTVDSGGPYTSGSTTTINIDQGDGNYELVMNDSFGDGICCDWGDGSYTVTDFNGNVLVTGGDYGTGETSNFCLENTSANLDTEAPTMPTNLMISDITENSATLEWDASTDNIAITGYEVYVNSEFIETMNNTNYSLSNLSSGTEYSIEIIAIDQMGNQSDAASNTFNTLNETADCSSSVEALLGSPNVIFEANPNTSYFFNYTMPEDGMLNIQIQIPNNLNGNIRVYDNGNCLNLVDEITNSDNLTTSEFQQGEVIFIEFEFGNSVNNTDVDWDFQLESTEPELNPECAAATASIEGLNNISNYQTASSYFFTYQMPADGSLFIESQNELMADVNLYLDNCSNEDLVGTKIEGFGSTPHLESVEFPAGADLLIEWVFTEVNYTSFEWNLLHNPSEFGNNGCYDGLQAYVGNSNYIPNVQADSSYFYYYSPGNIYSNNFRLSIEALSQTEGVNLKLHYQMNCQGDDIDSTSTGYLLSREVGSTLHHIEWEFTQEYTGKHFEWTFDEVLSADLAAQNITFAELPVLTYGDNDLVLDASASSGLDVTYESGNPNVAVESNGQISLKGAGTSVITAYQDGNANEGYLPAAPVERSLLVEKATLNASPENTTIAYGESLPDVSITYTGFIGSDTISAINIEPTVSTDATSVSSPGTYALTLSGGEADNYSFNFSSALLTIEKATQNITIEDIPSKTVVDQDFEINASSSSGLDLNYEILSGPATIQGTTISIDGTEGIVELRISQNGNENFIETSKTVSFEVTKVNQSITVENITDKTAIDNDFEVNASSTSGLELDYTILSGPATIQGNIISIQDNVGMVELEVSQGGSAIYNEATETISFEVLKANQNISFEPLESEVYGTDQVTLNATSSSGLQVEYMSSDENIATITDNVVTILSAGTVDITALQNGSTIYHPAEEVIQTLEIIKATQQIEVESIADKYANEASFEVIASSSSNLDLEYDILSGPATISGNVISLTGGFGIVELLISQAGNENYDPASVTSTFEVLDPCESFTASVENFTDVLCHGESTGSFSILVEGGAEPYEYILDGESFSENTFYDIEKGEYLVTVIDANNCSTDISVAINEPESIFVDAEIQPNSTTNGNGSISLNISGGSGDYTIDWSNNENGAEISGLLVGDYTATISDANGCSLTKTFTVGGINSRSNLNEKDFKLFPNPTTNYLTITHPIVYEDQQISIYDAKGTLIREFKATNGESTLNTSSFTKGLYFIQFDKSGIRLRFLKQ